jgi:hypothetical protein
VRVSVPEDGVLLYRRRGEEKGMNLDVADHTIIPCIQRHQLPDGLGLDTARRASARVARPSPFTNFTSGPPLVHPLS